MKAVLALAIVLLCALALYVATRRPQQDAHIDTLPLSSLAKREHALEPLVHRDDASLRSVAAKVEQAVLPSPPVSPTDAAIAFDVRVIVLSRGERLPLGNLAVKLAWWGSEKGAPIAQGTTDASGAVNLRLETGGVPREMLCRVSVGEGESARQFNALPLQDELTVLMDSCTRLHGRVVISGVELKERAWVAAAEPARGAMSCAVFMGRAQTQADGTFELQACPSREVPWVDVRVQVASVEVSRKIRWEELICEAGALIEIRFGELIVRVLEEGGAPVVGADVRVAPLGDSAPFPAVGKSDAHGEFRASLEPGEVEVIVGAKAFACASEKIHFEASSPPTVVELHLRALGDLDHVRGHVVREDGSPVEAAIVTGAPATDSREGAMAGFVQVRSAADGSFDLEIATHRELEVVAFRRDLGLSDELRFLPDGRELRLVIRAQGSLEVHVTLPSGMSAFASGLVEYVLVDRSLTYVDHGHQSEVPFQLDDVPIGDYNLFVYVASWNAYAEGSVHVGAGSDRAEEPPRVELVSHPAQFARGRVRTADGASMNGAELELDHPTWPPEVEKIWSSKIGADGRFEMLLGEETTCAAHLIRDGKSTNKLQLHAGDGAELVIP